LKETSKAITKASNINEAIEVAQTDQIINAVIEMKEYGSLAYQIGEVSPIYGPTAGTFALVYKNGKLQLLRGEVQVKEDGIEKTGLTMEAIQDLYSQYGKSATEYIAKIFGGISNMNENIELISRLSTWSTSTPALTLTDSKNAETSAFEIQQKTAELVLEINSTSFKSLDSFVILPKKYAASFLAVSNRLPDNKKEKGLFLGDNSRTRFYLNPDVNSTEAFVGISSEIPGQSSIIISPYHHAIISAVNPDDGETQLFNFNRYAITQSRLSEDQPMLYKFEIN